MLEKKLKKQVTIAGWELGLGIGILIGYIVMFTSLGHNYVIVGIWLGIGIMAICGIAHSVFWIIGIVNASSIHKITSDSSILIVFSVLTFWFGHLIVAISQKNKYLNSENEMNNNLFKKKLKQAFINGIISSIEYEQKLKEYRDR